MIKVDIYSGFLGAGKTTLIRKMISEAYTGEKLVLVENEFGDIGIDGGFLKDAGIEITEMNSGCICCSLVGDFTEALAKVASEFSPDRIIIEPSGVGKLSDIISAVKRVSGDFQLEGTIAVVDAQKCVMYNKNFGEFFVNQIQNANAVILSHTDKAKENTLSKAMELIHTLNSEARVISTVWDKISGAEIHRAMLKENTLADELSSLAHEHKHEHEHHHHDHDEHCECGHDHHHEHHHDHDEHCECGHDHHHDHDEHCGCGHDHHHDHHHADEVFGTWGVETAKVYDKNALESILTKLSNDTSFGTVLRAKGMVEGTDGTWIHFDLIPGEIDIRTGKEAELTGRICVIGADLEIETINNLFAGEA